ncbi:MAG: D-mannonate epimerase [Treponema sp.]|jgi:nickel-dependent lactate racemase|nr:D-mannonate epimerase [Treponema sp.]
MKEPSPLSGADLDRELSRTLENLFTSGMAAGLHAPPPAPGPVLILPPDITRIHSRAGLLTAAVCRYLDLTRRSNPNTGWRLGAIMPALGTHRPLLPAEIALMFPRCPPERFLPHRWREDTVELGRLPADWVEAAFKDGENSQVPRRRGESPFYTDWPVQVNRLLRDGLSGPAGAAVPFSLIISIGQVVPHEIAGMANHAKNIFIGTGGAEAIHKSHWLGALYGLERLMGRTENPVRSLFDEALRRYGPRLPPILWVLTVVDYADRVRGLFCGFGRKCFEDAAALAAKINIERIGPAPAAVREGGAGGFPGVQRAVVWLDPAEYRSTWLGNKAVYRTRRAMADGGELVILAPGLDCFGEDPRLDALIRRHGYRGTAAIRQAVEESRGQPGGLAANLSAAAHLIHGSSENRFTVTYCTPGGAAGGVPLLGRADIEGAGYRWNSLEEALGRYGLEDLARVRPGEDVKPAAGWRVTPNGEPYYFIRDPGLGLWTR